MWIFFFFFFWGGGAEKWNMGSIKVNVVLPENIKLFFFFFGHIQFSKIFTVLSSIIKNQQRFSWIKIKKKKKIIIEIASVGPIYGCKFNFRVRPKKEVLVSQALF